MSPQGTADNFKSLATTAASGLEWSGGLERAYDLGFCKQWRFTGCIRRNTNSGANSLWCTLHYLAARFRSSVDALFTPGFWEYDLQLGWTLQLIDAFYVHLGSWAFYHRCSNTQLSVRSTHRVKCVFFLSSSLVCVSGRNNEPTTVFQFIHHSPFEWTGIRRQCWCTFWIDSCVPVLSNTKQNGPCQMGKSLQLACFSAAQCGWNVKPKKYTASPHWVGLQSNGR